MGFLLILVAWFEGGDVVLLSALFASVEGLHVDLKDCAVALISLSLISECVTQKCVSGRA